MASTDATPLPLKNTALRITFPLWLTTGLVNSGAAGLDSEVSIDGGTFTDCTNEATEIATASGTYYLDLTSGEMNGDTIAIQTKSSTTNAITAKTIIYPSSGSKFQVNATQVGSQTASASGTVTFPSSIGTSTLTQTQVSGGAYALNSSSFSFSSSLDFTTTQKAATLARVTLADTLTTYTGNTVQTGDSFARIGSTGSGLTSLAPSSTALSTATWTGTLATNIGTTNSTVATNLDAAVTSRMATYVQPTGFLAANFTTGIPVSGTVTLTNGSIATATFAAGATIPRVTLADTVTTVTGLTASNLDATVSSRSTSAQVVKVLAATYDSATLSGSTLTLSNGATMVVSATGRITT